MDVLRYEALALTLKKLLEESNTLPTGEVLQTLVDNDDLLPLIPHPPFELLSSLQSIAKAVANELESNLISRDTSVEATTSVDVILECVLKIIEWLPTELLDSRSQMSIDPEPHSIIELNEDDLEPIGHRLLSVCLLIPKHPIVLQILRRMTERLEVIPSSEDIVVTCMTRFVEDIRAKGLPTWTAMRDSREGRILMTPAKAERMTEAQRLYGVFTLLQDSPLNDRIVDRLLPCALFVLDDHDTDVACYGAKSVISIIDGSVDRHLFNWFDVMHRTLSDRLLSCDVILWKELLSASLRFLDKCKESKDGNRNRRIPSTRRYDLIDVVKPSSAMIIFEKILERLHLDPVPYEMGDVFLDRATEWTRVLGLKIVRYFSKLFPLLIRWTMTASVSLQSKALETMQSIIEVSFPRIQRHVHFLRDVLDSIKDRADEASGHALEEKLVKIQACLDDVENRSSLIMR